MKMLFSLSAAGLTQSLEQVAQRRPRALQMHLLPYTDFSVSLDNQLRLVVLSDREI